MEEESQKLSQKELTEVPNARFEVKLLIVIFARGFEIKEWIKLFSLHSLKINMIIIGTVEIDFFIQWVFLIGPLPIGVLYLSLRKEICFSAQIA